MTDKNPNETPEKKLAGKGSETHEQVPGIRDAILADDDWLLNEAKQPLEGPDRTDLTEFYPEDILEDDPVLSEHQFEADPELEDQLTLHSGQVTDEDWDANDPPEPVDPPQTRTAFTRN